MPVLALLWLKHDGVSGALDALVDCNQSLWIDGGWVIAVHGTFAVLDLLLAMCRLGSVQRERDFRHSRVRGGVVRLERQRLPKLRQRARDISAAIQETAIAKA